MDAPRKVPAEETPAKRVPAKKGPRVRVSAEKAPRIRVSDEKAPRIRVSDEKAPRVRVYTEEAQPVRVPAEEALLAATAGLTRDDLVRWLGDAAKLWLAHDGLWFRAVEGARGLGEAVELDEQAMAAWSAGEARRIGERLGLPRYGGLDSLERALHARLYALLNRQDIRHEVDRLVLTMRTCRVQDARNRQGLPPFPCRSVGLREYQEFARAVDSRLKVTCRHCPPGELPVGSWCAWEFTVSR